MRTFLILIILAFPLWAASGSGESSSSSASAAAASGGASSSSVSPQIEEGWRWRNKVAFLLRENGLDLEEPHQELAWTAHRAYNALKPEGKKKNVLTFSFTLVFQRGESVEQVTVNPIYEFGEDSQPVLFVSREKCESDLVTGYLSLSGKDLFKNIAKSREELENRFSEDRFHHPRDCIVHPICEKLRDEQRRSGPEKWNSDYLHTEQFLLKWMNDFKDETIAQIIQAIPGLSHEGLLPEGLTIKAVILNVHTRLDMCERCAPSMYLEMVSDHPQSFSYGLRQTLQGMNPMKAKGLKEEPIFSVAVSSVFPYGNGKRRKFSGHDGKLNQTPKMTPYKHPFIQVPITIKPKPEPGLVILEKIP